MSHPKLPPLNEKYKCMLFRAAIFRFVTIFSEMRYLGFSHEAVSGMMSPRVRTGWFNAIRIGGGYTGFQLTPAACTELGVPTTIARPLGGVQSIRPHVGALLDCSHRRVMPIVAETADLSALQTEDYRLVPGEHHRLTFLLIDGGGNPVRLRYKIAEHFARFASLPTFASLFAENQFAIRVLTPTDGKAAVLAKLLAGRPAGRVEIEVVPELIKWTI